MRTTLMLCAATALAVGGIARSAAPPVVPRDFQPWWAPQGTTIAFQRLMPVTGGSDVFFTPVVRGKEVDLFGRGTLRGFRPGSGDVLVDTGSATVVRDSADRTLGSVLGTDASWSPDGSQIAYLENGALMVAAASGANPRELATGIVTPGTDVNGPEWSPDGASIAVATASADGSAIEIVPLDGTAPHVAYDGPGENVNPCWSHDGTSIAFDSNQGQGWSIWLVAPDGTGAHQAIATGSNNRYAQWSPVDDRLAFLSDRAGGYGLYVGTPDGTQQEVINDVSSDSPARWSPTGTALAVSSAHDCGRFGVYVVSSTAPFKAVRRSNQCRIDGTPGDDTIQGTPYPDLIYGYGGNDAIFGHGGNDVIYGGAGNDAIGGGPGNDVIYGGAGNDILSGGAGNDVIYAGPGRDKIGCGPGNDTAYIRPGDTVRACEHVRRS